MKTLLNITTCADKAYQINMHQENIKKKLTDRRVTRSTQKLAELIETIDDNMPKLYFLFGDTYPKKEEIKKAGWSYHNSMWYAHEKFDSSGFKIIGVN